MVLNNVVDDQIQKIIDTLKKQLNNKHIYKASIERVENGLGKIKIYTKNSGNFSDDYILNVCHENDYQTIEAVFEKGQCVEIRQAKRIRPDLN
jgi:hypothetical protein